MCYKEWPDCYKQCDNCDNLRHRDDLILVTDGAVDPDEKMICAQCASKQLSALRNEVRAARLLGDASPLALEYCKQQWLDAVRATDATGALEDK